MDQDTNKSMKKLTFSALLAAFTIIVCALVFVSATYAWFTNNVNTNVTPMQSSVGNGDVHIVISSSANGTYDVSAPITILGSCEELIPLSTDNLESFYYATARNAEGISYLYNLRSGAIANDLIHGEVYVKSEYADADLYFSRTRLSFSGGTQLLASLRMGMVITSSGTTSTYIFRLDDVANTAGAEARETISGASGSVIGSVDSGGNPSYVTDPALDLADFIATDTESAETEATPGSRMLCHLAEGQSARIELFFYMEGCDENTINSAQAGDISFDLGFCGVKTGSAS